MAYRPFPFEEFHRIVGGKNCVVARRTSKIVERYGEDVICLSQKRYTEAARQARIERYGTAEEET